MTTVIFSRVENRMRALLERGWRPRVTTHVAGWLDALERDDHRGPWTITAHHGERASCTGWVVMAVPSIDLAKRTATTVTSGVYATLDECLDEVEGQVDHQELRLSRIVTHG